MFKVKLPYGSSEGRKDILEGKQKNLFIHLHRTYETHVCTEDESYACSYMCQSGLPKFRPESGLRPRPA